MQGTSSYQTKSDVARQHIQEMILSGSARAGARITAREVSEALGMSETPIREAIRGLAAEGWLDFNAHLGVVVASVRSEHIVEVYAIRGALGALAIQLGGACYTAAQLAEIDANLAESQAAVEADDTTQYARLNRAFHLLLSDTPNTLWTLKLLTTLWAQTSAARRGFEAVPGRLRESLAEHRAIRAAIGAHDFARAAALLIEHERVAGMALIAGLSQSRASSSPADRPVP
ncbi:MAG: hypothetical protein ABS99_02605 [Acetobacteraceae bacterium SCN 69-10]|nr:MAG: hypothetical protein ABS99_02605 [Acetobacteraceae bacterium SCN 69-10]OJY76324.1 MAG: hypothetical protein BGP12_02245 [Rhodospirillales bacterium 70-18]